MQKQSYPISSNHIVYLKLHLNKTFLLDLSDLPDLIKLKGRTIIIRHNYTTMQANGRSYARVEEWMGLFGAHLLVLLDAYWHHYYHSINISTRPDMLTYYFHHHQYQSKSTLEFT